MLGNRSFQAEPVSVTRSENESATTGGNVSACNVTRALIFEKTGYSNVQAQYESPVGVIKHHKEVIPAEELLAKVMNISSKRGRSIKKEWSG